MKIEKFEDIQAWEEARKLVKRIYLVVEGNTRLNRDLRFRSQITSAAVSIMSNIAEGFARKSDKEFAQFLFISKGSTAELQSLMYVALDLEYVPRKDFDEIYKNSDKTARLISKFITYLRSSLKK